MIKTYTSYIVIKVLLPQAYVPLAHFGYSV
jgi:hypothetical protein